MNKENLKPCPFCGGEAEILKEHLLGEDYYAGRCRSCAATSTFEFTKEEATADWNRRVCVKQNAEKLDANSVASNQLNTKLTYADIKKMVKPLEWKLDCFFGGDSLAEFGNALFRISFWGEAKYIVFYNAGIIKGGFACLDDAKQAAQDFLVDLVAAALGVERSGE